MAGDGGTGDEEGDKCDDYDWKDDGQRYEYSKTELWTLAVRVGDAQVKQTEMMVVWIHGGQCKRYHDSSTVDS